MFFITFFYAPNIDCTKPVAEADNIQITVPIIAATNACFATDMFDGLAVAVIYIIPATINPIIAKLAAIAESCPAKWSTMVGKSAANAARGATNMPSDKDKPNVFLFTLI